MALSWVCHGTALERPVRDSSPLYKELALNCYNLRDALVTFVFVCFQLKTETEMIYQTFVFSIRLTHLSLASLLWDIGKQNNPRCDATIRSVPSGAILFA